MMDFQFCSTFFFFFYNYFANEYCLKTMEGNGFLKKLSPKEMSSIGANVYSPIPN
jgi:hypothetical protein